MSAPVRFAVTPELPSPWPCGCLIADLRSRPGGCRGGCRTTPRPGRTRRRSSAPRGLPSVGSSARTPCSASPGRCRGTRGTKKNAAARKTNAAASGHQLRSPYAERDEPDHQRGDRCARVGEKQPPDREEAGERRQPEESAARWRRAGSRPAACTRWRAGSETSRRAGAAAARHRGCRASSPAGPRPWP